MEEHYSQLGVVVVVVVIVVEAVVAVGMDVVHCLADKDLVQIGDNLHDTDRYQMWEHPLLEVFVTCDCNKIIV